MKRTLGATDATQGLPMRDDDLRAALERHWAASDANDFETEHQIYDEIGRAHV